MPYADSVKQREYMRAYDKIRQVRDKQEIAKRKKKYSMENPEIVKNQKHSTYLKKREHYAEKSREYYHTNKDAVKEIKKKYRNSPKGRLSTYQKSAVTRGLDFSLSTDEFTKMLTAECHYCGKNNCNGIDRKNSDLGYFSYNAVPCCKVCNWMKGTLGYQEFINHIKAISAQFT